MLISSHILLQQWNTNTFFFVDSEGNILYFLHGQKLFRALPQATDTDKLVCCYTYKTCSLRT